MTFDIAQTPPRYGYNSHRLLMSLHFAAGDLAAVLASFGVGFFIVNAVNMTAIDFKSFVLYWPYLPFFLLVLHILKLYPGVNYAHADELRRFAIASFFGHAGILIALNIQRKINPAISIAFALSFFASLPAFMTVRGLIRRFFVNTPFWGIPVVIIGGGRTGRMIADRLLDRPSIGLKPMAILDDDPSLGPNYRSLPLYHGSDNAEMIREAMDVDTAIVAMPGVEREKLAGILAKHAKQFRNITIIPDFFGVANLWMSVRDVGGILGIHSDQNLLKPSNLLLKRVTDLILAMTGGLLLLPVFALIALFVALDSKGPVFYAHKRLGRYGRPMRILKFRTMHQNADKLLADILENDPEAREEWEASFKLRKDPRVTRVGRILRKTSLDELPQLWNVIKGDMSLVGPRPIIEAEVEKYGDDYELFSSVKPGVSGLWQISGRSETDYVERVSLDSSYIQSWSFWLDLYIIFRTVAVVFEGKGAY